MDAILADLKFAARTLRKQPAFTATIVATLALAIGASTAIFSVVEATLLRPLPFRSPDRVAFLNGVAGPDKIVRGGSIPEVLDWSRMSRSFDGVSIYNGTSLNLRTDRDVERVQAEMVSASFFSILGVTPQIGRVFTADEDRLPDEHPVVVISDAMWTDRFGRDSSIVGKSITLSDQSFTVLGVMRPGFKGLSFTSDVWFPAMMAHVDGAPKEFMTARGRRQYGAIGRLKPNVTLEAAQADVDRVAKELAGLYPGTNTDRGVQLQQLRDSYLGTMRQLVLAVFAAVGLLLLIACANVVGLQLVRASGRKRELALRMAIGADRGRLVQQLTVEGLLLAVVSAAAGLLVARWGLDALITLIPNGLLPNYAQPAIDVWAFAFAGVVAIGCGLVVGTIPALRGSRVNLTRSLKEGSRGSSEGFGRGLKLGSQQLLVVGQTAVAIVLLVGAGLFVVSLRNQLAVPLGFDPTNVTRTRFSLPAHYNLVEDAQFIEQLEARLRQAPGITSASLSGDIPLGGGTSAAFVRMSPVTDPVRFYRHSITPEMLTTLGIRVTAGRAFTTADRAGTPRVVMVSASTARRFWPNQNPVGKRIELPDGPAEVIGVLADVRFRDLTTRLGMSEPDVYQPYAQRPVANLQILTKSTLDQASIAAIVRREMAALDAAIPIFGARRMEELVELQSASGRLASVLLMVFGGVALLLTAVGLYGLLAFFVSLRGREIGIRMALGASASHVSRAIVWQGSRLVMLGVVAGCIGAAASTHYLASQLFGVDARDPMVFVSVAVSMLGVAVLASWVPARRAARVDPQVALRAD